MDPVLSRALLFLTNSLLIINIIVDDISSFEQLCLRVQCHPSSVDVANLTKFDQQSLLAGVTAAGGHFAHAV